MESRPFPNETREYRDARNELLKAEDALRAQTERVAALRRTLPLGGEVKEDYAFEALTPEGGVSKVLLSDLFDEGKEALFLYGFMYGPEMENACPMCTAFLDSLDGNVPHLQQRISVAVSARSPIERIDAHAKKRGWKHLRLVSAAHNSYARDYFHETGDGAQVPFGNVFVKREGRIHHFWGTELFHVPRDGHPRHVDALWPLWNVLDLTPEGRGDFVPALDYPR